MIQRASHGAHPLRSSSAPTTRRSSSLSSRLKSTTGGDARCDCATAHVMFAGVPLVVDPAPCVSIFTTNSQARPPRREALREEMRATLHAGAINQLREHYVKVREYGRDRHFRYMDFTRLQQGDVVGWGADLSPPWHAHLHAEQQGARRRGRGGDRRDLVGHGRCVLRDAALRLSARGVVGGHRVGGRRKHAPAGHRRVSLRGGPASSAQDGGASARTSCS